MLVRSCGPEDGDGLGTRGCDIGAVERIQTSFYVYNSIVLKHVSFTPDLVVTSIRLSQDDIEVVIQNLGLRVTDSDFWVDLYISPDAPPTTVNETWATQGGEGLAWGLTDLKIYPQESVTLTLASPYLDWAESSFSGQISLGAPIYVQVDAAHVGTDYGNVLENHEVQETIYNNITTVSASTAVSVTVPIRP